MGQVDLPATLAKLSGAEFSAKASPDSRNLLPALLGTSKKGRDYLVEHGRGVALRFGPWKYIPESEGRGRNRRPDGEAKGELYNLADDPGETTNLYDDRADVAQELMAILQKQIDQGYSRPL